LSEKREIYFCTASRSERSLIDPLLERLRTKFDLMICDLPTTFVGAFLKMRDFLKEKGAPDLVFTPFDRLEMLGASIGCLVSNVRTAQIHSGDLSEGTWDDVARHMIMLGSDYQFCTSQQSHIRATTVLMTLGRSIGHCYQVKPIHFDDLKIDYDACVAEPFDLVVYNPPTARPDLIEDDLDTIEVMIDKTTLWVSPNEDEGNKEIGDRIASLDEAFSDDSFPYSVLPIGTLPRSQFLGLLEKCERAIGNSSSFFYELPYFNKTHIQVGLRNKDRERLSPEQCVSGGSDEIVKILEATL
jgi:hypothetical protein